MVSTESFDDNRELLQGFVEESFEMLEEVEPRIMELEKTALASGEVDKETINSIFRLFHSLKGGAGFLNLDTIKMVTHDAETLLDLFRKGKAQLASEHIDLMTRTCDFIRLLLNKVQSSDSDRGYESEAEQIAANIRSTINDLTALPLPPYPPPTAPPPPPPPESAPALTLEITPELSNQFVTEAFELLENAETALLELEKTPGHPELLDKAFRSLHSFKGNAGFLGYADLQGIAHKVESALDQIRSGEIEPQSDLFSLMLEILDFLRGGVEQIAQNKIPKIGGYQGILHLLEDTVNRYRKVESPTAQPKIVIEGWDDITAAESLVQEITDTTLPAKETAPPHPEIKPIPQKLDTTAEKIPESKTPAADSASQRQSIRVDITKLDILLDLVGELVIAEAMVSQNPFIRKASDKTERLEKSLRQLDKITRDLQDVSTSIRMVPLAATFKKLIRLVRDLSQKAGKKVELEIIGEETEVDKTVIEQITDPLVHIIRNSIDHGIDFPQERTALGKPETGKITVEAKHIGGEVWISVADDGRGLNREKILAKALEKGIIEGDGSELSDEDVWQLIFAPGFSTADKVTEVSGRGVGMDVVKRNIENIRGKTDLKSKKDRGATVTLRIPLTLAIIDGMIVRLGKQLYIIPIIDIKETLRPVKSQITHMADGSEIINIRSHLLPVIRLNQLFGAEMNSQELTDGLIIVVENHYRSVCLFVDELVGQQQVVIKGLSAYLGNVGYVSGCTILGDGTVSLIVDISGICDTMEVASEV